MIAFRDRPIRIKLILSLMSTSAVVLILAASAFFIEAYSTFREDAIRNLRTQAAITADSTESLLSFNDSESATDTLAVLKADPHIIAAAIYDADQRLFAKYGLDELAHPISSIPSTEDTHLFSGDHLETIYPIRLRGKTIGSVHLYSDLEQINSRLIRYLWIGSLVLLGAMLLAYWLAIYFQRLIAVPIQQLAAAAQKVSSDENYTIRVAVASNDEIGTLVKTFNNMLFKIGLSDSSLRSEISERQRAEALVHKLNDELEERVHSRTLELETAVKELESFSYSVSHDLRAPLRGIDGWSLALMEDYGDKLDATGQDYIARVRSEAQRMGLLISDLLQLSRLTQTSMKMSSVNLSAIAQSLVARLQETDPERDVEWDIAPDLKTDGDAGLLEAALMNLLDNAWKFTGKRASAKIEFGRMIKDGQSVYFVRDNGVGFDPVFATKLFSAFQRMHKQSEFPGTGIGLANVQRIINRHGGRIWAESAPDKGATFFFTFRK